MRALAEAVRSLGDGAGEAQVRAAAEAWVSAAIRVDLSREAAVRG